MDLRFAAEAPGGPGPLFEVVADLGQYPRWLELVHRVQPAEPDPADGGPAYLVDLRARLGPLARSKRLRMVRVEHRPDERVRFARRELDGREHAAWELSADVRSLDGRTSPASEVSVRLHYGGSLWGAPLELALASHVERAVPRLQALVAAAP